MLQFSGRSVQINSNHFIGRNTRLEIRDAFSVKDVALQNLVKQREKPDESPFSLFGCEQKLPSDLGLDCDYDPRTFLKNTI